MGEYTLKVPAEHVDTFRQNVYSSLGAEGETLEKRANTLAFPGGRSWDEFIAGDPGNAIERYAVDVLNATRKIAALAEVMEQLGWTDPIAGDVELTGDPGLLGSLIEGCLADVGGTVTDITEKRPFDRAAYDAATTWGGWLADRHAEVEAVAS